MHILITGASSGIGESLARHFASGGHALTLVARRTSELHAIAAAYPAVKVFVRPADLSDPAVCAAVVADAEREVGPIDVLINNAGVQYVEPGAGVSPERVINLFNVDLVSPLILMHHVLSGMTARRAGVVVNIASVAGIVWTPGMTHYNAAKSGLAAASETLHVELKGQGVHVVTVYPGPVETPMEAAARGAFVGSQATVNAMPTGTADELSRLIERAITGRKRRVIYPRFYHMTRYFRLLSQWITDAATPPVKPRELP
jgi:short-subunit dehydrogenase